MRRHPRGGARVVAVADPAPAARARAAELFPAARTFGSHRELLDLGLDAVFVTSPDDTHAQIAVDLLTAGVPVYLEKPMATTVADADRILLAAQRSGTRLYVGHNMRHMAVVRVMKQAIDRGEIGAVQAIWCRHFVGHGGDYYFKDWHADRSRSTGLLLQKGAHDIDVIGYLAGSHCAQVVGMGELAVYGKITDRRDNSDRLMPQWFSKDNWPPGEQRELNPVVDVEDISMVSMRLANGATASYQQCHFTPDYWRNYTVIGDRGRLENFGDGNGALVRVWNRRADYAPEGDLVHRVVEDAAGHLDADAACVAEFLDFVRTGAPTVTSPLAARHAVAAAVGATESIRDHSMPRVVPPVPPEVVAYFTDHQRKTVP